MKNKLLKISALLLTMSALVSCGANSKLVGNWSDGYGAFGTSIQFSEGGKVVMRDSGMSVSGTYKVSGGNIEVTVDGEKETYPYELDGEMLEIEVNGRTLNLSR